MKNYLILFENIIMSGVSRKQDKFQGNVTVFEGCGGMSSGGFITFTFNGHNVRGKMIDGDPWLVGKDVAEALGYTNTRDALYKHVDDDDKTTVAICDTGSNYKTRAVFINESGIYSLVFGSKLKESKEFKRWVTKEVLPAIRKTGHYGKTDLPDFIRRLRLNFGQVPPTHFSVISELFNTAYLAFEKAGHVLSEKAADGVKLRPDVSVGRCFSLWLERNGYDPEDDRITYEHKFPDGYSVNAYAYPNRMLGVFRDYVYQEWLPKHAARYLKTRDPRALEYLPRLLDNRKAS